MPLIHVRTFRVRHYECDAYGHVNHANYLRYMQEAAFDASAAAGFDAVRYQAMDRSWLIRETEIEYYRPVRYGDSISVETWVVDLRRIRSRRAYDLRLVDSGKPVARASTDWVFLELSSGRPVTIPAELKTAFMPEGVPDPPPRDRFPQASPPPNGPYRQLRRVEWRDLDAAGHVNNAIYLSYVEDCGLQAIKAYGWPISRMEDNGFAVVARRHRIEYRQPAALDDQLAVSTWLSAIRDTTAVRHTIITQLNGGTLVARAETLHVWLDRSSGQRTATPDRFLADLAPIISA